MCPLYVSIIYVYYKTVLWFLICSLSSINSNNVEYIGYDVKSSIWYIRLFVICCY